MTADRYHELASAIRALETEGISISTKHLHQRLGGSYPALVQALREYRALVAQVATQPSTDVVVDAPAEAPLPAPSLWTPPACPKCEARVVWLVHGDLWTCTVCSTSIRRLTEEEG
jgi:hypothetical protein